MTDTRTAIDCLVNLLAVLGHDQFERAYNIIADRVDAARENAMKLCDAPGDPPISDEEAIAMITTVLLHIGTRSVAEHSKKVFP